MGLPLVMGMSPSQTWPQPKLSGQTSETTVDDGTETEFLWLCHVCRTVTDLLRGGVRGQKYRGYALW